jgi:hypothetical protein
MTTVNAGSGLSYHGTTIEVQLGDRVLVKRFLRRSLLGTVVYIPGVSPGHPDLEVEGIQQWASSFRTKP